MNFTDVQLNEGLERQNRYNKVSLKKVSGIELRFLPPYIKNNKTPKIWPFPGRAHLYCLVIVVNDIDNQFNYNVDIFSFPGVGDKELLYIDRSIFYWENDNEMVTVPEQVHVMCSIIKSKEKLRNVASIFNNLSADTHYLHLINKLLSIVSATSNGNLIVNLTLKMVEAISKYLGKIDDKPLATIFNSYTYLHGDLQRPGTTPIFINTQNVDFSFELIIE